jgi:3-oxoacyl-[acyl-carrier-protein] synthase II
MTASMADRLRRVVVTGMAGLSPIGQDWASARAALEQSRGGVRRMAEWERIDGMVSLLGAPVADFVQPEHYSRKALRTMGRVALLSVRATELALADAGLSGSPMLADGGVGVAYGSTIGSPPDAVDFALMLEHNTTRGVNATKYLKMMSHTAAINVGVYFGLRGRIIPTSSACTSGSQGIGFGYEAIRFGRSRIMLCGGSEELSPTQAIVFDTLGEASRRNDEPTATPRPFDRARDGLVIGEGAATLVLEDLESAQARGATIYAEVVGFGTNSDGEHVTQPRIESMSAVMQLALADAQLPADAIGYVNAHGTATAIGDVAESKAMAAVFGARVPTSSLKGHLGHTLGACGALEAWLTIEMQRARRFAPTLNLHEIDPQCAPLDYIVGEMRAMDCEYVMNNNFAFGGVNTSLIFRRWSS